MPFELTRNILPSPFKHPITVLPMDNNEPIKDFGVMVNNEPAPSLDQPELTLRITPSLFHTLTQAAKVKNYPTVEDYCIHKLIESTQTKIGAAHIDSPYQQNGLETKKISGPVGGIVSRIN